MLVLHVFSRHSIDVSRRFDPIDSTEFFRHATSHCTEFAVDRFATLDCSRRLIRSAATCQKFALHCVGSPATLIAIQSTFDGSTAHHPHDIVGLLFSCCVMTQHQTFSMHPLTNLNQSNNRHTRHRPKSKLHSL